MLPKLRAVFFATGAGREPVREWLTGLGASERKLIGTDIAYVQFKWPLGKPRVDHLRGPMWEMRTRLRNRIARGLFVDAGDELILLHAFVRQTQKTPHDEIDLSLCAM